MQKAKIRMAIAHRLVVGECDANSFEWEASNQGMGE
jgi:hypothetical protein